MDGTAVERPETVPDARAYEALIHLQLRTAPTEIFPAVSATGEEAAERACSGHHHPAKSARPSRPSPSFLWRDRRGRAIVLVHLNWPLRDSGGWVVATALAQVARDHRSRCTPLTQERAAAGRSRRPREQRCASSSSEARAPAAAVQLHTGAPAVPPPCLRTPSGCLSRASRPVLLAHSRQRATAIANSWTPRVSRLRRCAACQPPASEASAPEARRRRQVAAHRQLVRSFEYETASIASRQPDSVAGKTWLGCRWCRDRFLTQPSVLRCTAPTLPRPPRRRPRR